jgi:hypothetical protein
VRRSPVAAALLCILSVLWGLVAGCATDGQNLLTNPGFETGTLAGWSDAVGAGIVAEPVHSGIAACRLFGPPGQEARIRQFVAVQPGQAYWASVWVNIARTEIVDWGYISISATARDWSLLAGEELTASTHGTGQWVKVALRFTATDDLVRLEFGKFAHPASNIEFYVDDAYLAIDDGVNVPPQIAITVTPSVVGSLPATVTYAMTGDDPDGAIEHVYWDFGDGGHALTPSGLHAYVTPGVFAVRAYAVDDLGAVAQATTTVTATDPSFPALTIMAPEDGAIVATDAVTLTGLATQAAYVRWSTDRGAAGTATGTSPFTALVPLEPGRNRILVEAWSDGGSLSTGERLVHYVPPGELAVINVQHPPYVECWEPLVVTFEVLNSRATTYDWPYDPEPPPGIPAGVGISVDGEFSSDGFASRLVQPAFYYRGYQRAQREGREWLYPTGDDTWMVRFAPPAVGTWQVRLRATDAGGTVITAPTTFTVTPPTLPQNRGFVRTAPLDPRYLRFDDGTPFAGVGHNIGFGEDVTYEADAFVALVGSDTANFFRLWLSGANIFGSAWIPWTSRTLQYEGTVPPTALSAEQAYGDGLFSTRLDSGNPLMFTGFQGGDRGLIPGRTYRVHVRAKLVDVQGPARPGYPFGLTVKRTGWPDPPDFQPDYSPIVAHQAGSRGWAMYAGDFVATEDFLGYLVVMLENTTRGTAFIDEISLREVQGPSRLGPELLRRGRANYHMYFDPVASFQYDHVLRQASLAGHHYRLVISEKQDHILTRLSRAGFVERNPDDANFDAPAGHPSRRYQEYYWRYLTARWGAERSVQSWELANEQNPYSTLAYAHADDFAAWLLAHDPHRHAASTSFWATFPLACWRNPTYPHLSPADVHAYVPYGTPENVDAAAAHWTLARELAAHDVGKPIVRGETGLAGPEGTNDENADLALDTAGVWLHNLTWSQLDSAVLYELYWWTGNIMGNNGAHGPLYYVYRSYRAFYELADPSSGPFVDAGATASDPRLRVVGQVSTGSHRGHLWIQHRDHTWRNVVDGVVIAPVSATVTVPGLPPATTFRVRWFDTYAGTFTAQEPVVTTNTGELVLNITNLTTDVAVLFGVADRPGDVDQDGDTDARDFVCCAQSLNGPGILTPPTGVPQEWFVRSDLPPSDGDVDLGDLCTFQRVFSGP